MEMVNEGLVATIEDKLKEEGVVVDLLVVAGVGQLVFIGELAGASGEILNLRNPKRFVRIERLATDPQTGKPVEFKYDSFIVDFDHVASGCITVVPNYYFHLSAIDTNSKREYLALLEAYFENKKKQRMAKVGLHLARSMADVGPEK